jgi:DNA mismatch endonuclease (patch repair protein)
MRANKKRDTGPELIVRKLLYSLGYRYRLHALDLPGKPDIVFRSRRKVIFVHGCFWHQHEDARCPLRSHPRSNVHYWGPKLARNRERDRENERKIAEIGWSVLVIWECELSNIQSVQKRLGPFLSKLPGR